MIILQELKESDKERLVVYDPGYTGATKEEGVITSWNTQWIFVRYGSQQTSKATSPRNLTFVNK